MVEAQSSNRNVCSTQPPHYSINCFPQDGLRYAIFSGPDGLAPNRSHVLVDKRPIGTHHYTTEATYDTDYLWRFPRGLKSPFYLRPRSCFAGEVGWHTYTLKDPDPSSTGHQILTSELWREVEDVSTHRYQNPWYPGLGEVGDPDREGAYFRHFPYTGQNTSMSLKHRSHSSKPVTPASRSVSTSHGCRWPRRRAPAATPITVYNGDTVNVEPSDDGVDGSKQGEYRSPLAVTHYNLAQIRQREQRPYSTFGQTERPAVQHQY